MQGKLLLIIFFIFIFKNIRSTCPVYHLIFLPLQLLSVLKIEFYLIFFPIKVVIKVSRIKSIEKQCLVAITLPTQGSQQPLSDQMVKCIGLNVKSIWCLGKELFIVMTDMGGNSTTNNSGGGNNNDSSGSSSSSNNNSGSRSNNKNDSVSSNKKNSNNNIIDLSNDSSSSIKNTVVEEQSFEQDIGIKIHFGMAGSERLVHTNTLPQNLTQNNIIEYSKILMPKHSRKKLTACLIFTNQALFIYDSSICMKTSKYLLNAYNNLDLDVMSYDKFNVDRVISVIRASDQARSIHEVIMEQYILPGILISE